MTTELTGVDFSAEMCSNYPKGIARTTSPKPGDLIVFGWGTYGHVAVVTGVGGDSVHVLEQNSSPTGVNTYKKGTAECFLTAK